ncbi:MAG: hypothetical protein GXO02_03905 [Epsilonproteobacteria bacterium]|nr:hypothetical protein [Campylobacterota bacterium]
MLFSNSQQQVVDLFIAAYGRAPTKSGLDFFASKLESGEWTKADIAHYMVDIEHNPEAVERFPAEVGLEELVISVFEHVLGRPPATQEGLEYWVGRFENFDYTLANLLEDVIEEANKQEVDRQTLENKREVAKYFIEHVPEDKQIGNQPYLDNVTSDPESLKEAIENINRLVENLGETANNIGDDNDSIYSYTNDGIGELVDSNNYIVESLDSNYHWDRDVVTFSFNETIPPSYEASVDEIGWEPLNSAQREAVRSIASEVNNLIDIKLTEVEDNGDIRFNIVDMNLMDMGDDIAGFSFYPAEEPDYMGDVFLSSQFNSDPKNYGLDRGEGGWTTIVHELGHALGLKHPFEAPNILPDELDDTNHTVMSYTTKDDIVPQITVDGTTIKMDLDIIYPQAYSLYDIATLQSIYGANTAYHTENNIYTLSYDDYKIETIWDAGGEDTIDLSNTTGTTVLNMHSGTINSVDIRSVEEIISFNQEIVHKNGIEDVEVDEWIANRINILNENDLLYTGKNNFSIAQGVIIENLITGSGDDIVMDNEVDNIIKTGRGDDIIYLGSGGFDYIDGGEGRDIIYLDLNRDEIELKQLDNQIYSIISPVDKFEAEIVGVEELYFEDGSSILL